MRFRYALAIVGFVLLCRTASAQQWATKMFASTSHDFGTVARGAKVEYAFVVENIYEEEAHIAAVRSSCGCTTPEIGKSTLKTWEKTAIKAIIDTRGFMGRKDATLTVEFDKPFAAEVQLHVYVLIRSDVVVQPGAVNFGNVTLGQGARQKVQVSYAGRDDWKIARVESANPNITAEAVETERNGGTVKYDLIVTLKDSIPAGYVQDHVVLVTNDFAAASARVPVPVEGIVGESLTVHPSPLLLVVESGQTVSRPLVVRGRQPFRITGVQCADARLKATLPADAKAVQLLSVELTGGPPGSANATMRLQTDIAGGKTIDVPVQMQITPAQAPRTSSPGAQRQDF